MTRWPAIAGLIGSLVLAACGGSGHSTSAARSATTGSAAATPTATATTTAATTTVATTTVSTITTATTSSRPPEVPAGKAESSTSSHPTAPDTDVRLPADFVIEPDDSLTPPFVAAPVGVTIQLGVRNLDREAHSFVLDTPKPYTIAVAPRGQATVLIAGLRKGTYRLLVDGTPRGQLVIGSAPGP